MVVLVYLSSHVVVPLNDPRAITEQPSCPLLNVSGLVRLHQESRLTVAFIRMRFCEIGYVVILQQDLVLSAMLVVHRV